MSATCAVCGKPCRSRCAKCGARLCYLHKPDNARRKCQLCASGVSTAYYTPKPAVPAYVAQYTPPRKPIDQMTMVEQATYITELRQRLVAKQTRERAYLDRRASRGTHTPTDEAYEADQKLEDEIIAVLDLMVKHAQQEGLI